LSSVIWDKNWPILVHRKSKNASRNTDGTLQASVTSAKEVSTDFVQADVYNGNKGQQSK
jgi:hypothetical protein